MRDRVSVSSSGPFLIELLIGLAVFALAAAICVQIFVGAHQISNESSNLNNAMIRAQSGAEIFKASNGNLSEVAEILEVPFEGAGALGTSENGEIRQFFDANWHPIAYFVSEQHEDFRETEFILTIRSQQAEIGYIYGDVTVSDVSGILIFELNIAVLEATQ